MIFIDRIGPDGTAHKITIRAHDLIADMNPSDGGTDAGPDPHDLYDAALGACTALTMLWYAQRKGIALEDIHVGIERDSSDERNGTYRLIKRIAVDGDLSDEERAKLLDVAAKCPIHKLMTDVTTEIETIAV
jgi:putative redox protein